MYQINPFWRRDFGALVTQLRFEDSPETGSYANAAYPTHGPATFNRNNPGVALSSAQAYEGSQSLHFSGSFDNANGLESVGTTDLTFRAAPFQIKMFAYFGSVLGFWGQGLMCWESTAPHPTLYLDTAGVLTYANQVAFTLNSGITPTLNAWHEIEVNRDGAGLVSLLYDGTVAASGTDASDYPTTGFSKVHIGAFGNGAGGLVSAYLDLITIRNGNI